MSSKQIHHPSFGQGSVLVDNGATLVVRFEHGIEEVLASEIRTTVTAEAALEEMSLGSPAEAVARVQAAAISSLNDAWGVFSRSRISLLPHQLWVCHRALREWPVRLLIADDVGLGKTVEAGLILWPLIARGVIRRLLILTPASLVEQWQFRMRQMFDIRLSIYQPELDQGKRDFWNVHQQVVASLPTMRLDRNDRHERLLDAPGWDMVIIDEAHHLHADESTGKTLGFQLIEKMDRLGKIASCVLFTATPHRGKDFGFWSLMSLVDANSFGPNKPHATMLKKLPERLIRNAKQKVVDMDGNRLFQAVLQFPETFQYSEEESEFYRMMTTFIASGKAYASTLSSQGRGQVMLVLIALQKLASSSVAAVRGALRTRLVRIQDTAATLRSDANDFFSSGEATDDQDALRRWMAAERRHSLQLMDDEILHLEKLLLAAVRVVVESRVERVLEIVDKRFNEKSVLLFTEYKATQALIFGALLRRYGENSVGFINGDGRLNGVTYADGRVASPSVAREDITEKFNNGQIRFLISTEAGGEGIDLQQQCHCLIHVDLPWNPMRLHQRVGRVNRFGQTRQVQVVSLRNPDTVESHIWSRLEEKLGNIMRALGAAMDEPEDLLQLVLGMIQPGLFESLFQEGGDVPRERFDQWFDHKTQNFGGQEAVDTVVSLVGHAASFDLSGLKQVPRADLPDLEPFFFSMLRLNGKRPEANEDGISFVTPDTWRTLPSVLRRYERMVFCRDVAGKDAQSRILGVGHPLIDHALQQAKDFDVKVAAVSGLACILVVCLAFERVTTGKGQVKRLLLGVEHPVDGETRVVRDVDVLNTLNASKLQRSDRPEGMCLHLPALELIERSRRLVESHIVETGFPFVAPAVAIHSILLPLSV